MSPEERQAIQAIEKRVALENEFARRKTEQQIETLEDEMNPTTKSKVSKFIDGLKNAKYKLPKITMK